MFRPCPSCGHAHAHDLAWETTSKAEAKRRSAHFIYRLDALTRWRSKLGHWLVSRRINKLMKGRVLDIGCGDGCTVKNGAVPFGIEISREQAAIASPVFEARGGCVINAPAVEGLDAFDPSFFDAILMRSYLEHESQPSAVLAKVFELLRPGGKVYVKVPNFAGVNRRVMGSRWCGFRFPDHVSYFTGKSLRRVAQAAGFEYRRLNVLSPFDDNIIAVLTRHS